MKKNVLGGLYSGCELLMKLAWLNMLWLLFTLLGGIILGFAPSTCAMLAVVRKWLRGEGDQPISPLFIKVYQKEWVKTNVLGMFFFIVFSILLFNYQVFSASSGIVSFIMIMCTFVSAVVFLAAFFYLFPLYVHYELPLKTYVQQALLCGIARPVTTLCLFISSAFIFYVLYTVPGLIPFYGGAFFALTIMFFTMRIFQRIDELRDVGAKK
ncbi:YesL family protein [Bacillus sp. NPDC077027]|uniref:YesL family protein n=1 Tax=Bacillus sp. NPDC077027 TaxID=3390548 RepID=UPI003D071EF2